MIRNYIWVIHIIIEMIIIGNTQPAHGTLGTSPESLLKVLATGTYGRASGDQYKNWWFYEKNVFQK